MKLIGKKLLKTNYKTVIIDLTLSEMDILKKADKHSVRKNIERSEKRGVIVKNIANDVSAFYKYAKMLYQSRMRLGIETRTIEQIYNEISALTTHKDYTAFMAFWNGIPIGAIGCRISNKRITEQGLARTLLNDAQKLYCVDLLRWHLILYGKKMACTEYDLGGISDMIAKEINISRNKMKWNGNITIQSRYA